MTKKSTNRNQRTKSNAKGKKKEITAIGQVLRELGGLGGSALGGLVGQHSLGNAFGRDLAGTASKWLGFGDYTVSSNSVLRNMQANNGIPMMHKNDQTIIVRHKEYLGEVDGSTGFQVQSTLPLNPGVSATFPWLSAVASRFQEYALKGVVFHYVPTSGTAISSTNAALGSVMFQTTYRATDVPPGNKVEMMNEYWATEGRPCDMITHAIECDPKENPFNIHYVRNGVLGSDENKLLYDIGTTHVATNGMQTGGQTVGDLWITYEVELKKPVLASEVSDPARAGSVFALSSSLTAYFDAPGPAYGGNLDFSVAGRTITLPKGSAGFFYVAVVFYSNTAWTAGSTSNVVTLSGATLQVTSPSQPNSVINTISADGNNLTMNFAVFKPDPNDVATLGLGSIVTTAGTLTSYAIEIFRRDSPLW